VLGAFDDGNAFAEVRGLGTALFTGRTAADHDEVESVTRNHTFLRMGLAAKPAKYNAVESRGIVQDARRW
jgi:hypothetical protein